MSAQFYDSVRQHSGENKLTNKNNDLVGRRSVLSGIGIAAAAVAGGTTTANAATGGFEPTRHVEDGWMDELAGGHRVFLDSSSPDGGAVAMLYANNILNGHTKTYEGGEESDYAMIVCLRHYSTVFGFGDEVWAKYGEGFYNMVGFADPSTGEAPKVNLMQVAGLRGLPNGGNTIESLGARGVKFAICDNAANVMSMGLSRAGFGEAKDIYADLVASAIPNSRFVSAGVVAATRAQEYGYSLLYAG